MTNHKRGCHEYVLTHIRVQFTDVCYFYLLKIITSIIKANTIIVSAIKPKVSKYIITNKTSSIIVPPSSSSMSYIKVSGNHICLSSFPMLNTILHFFTEFKRTLEIFTKNLFLKGAFFQMLLIVYILYFFLST